ncbi:MAG: Gx transporter family protein [Desulfobacterales bacterium]
MNENRNLYKVALLVSLACVLQISESLIPHPIPGLRLGLANMLTLTALVLLGFRYALEIAVLRTLLSSFIMGTFMSPTFILSLSGAVVSTVVMGAFFWLSRSFRGYRLSIIGISIVGALTHNVVQLSLAYLLLIRHTGIFALLPWLCIGGLVTGWVTGVVAAGVCRKIDGFQNEGVLEALQSDPVAPAPRDYQAGDSFLHRLSAETKIVGLFFLALIILVFSNMWLYLWVSTILTVLMVSCGASPGYFFGKVKRYAFLILMAFFLPLFFNSGTHVLLNIAHLKITAEGLRTGGFLATRILFLLTFSTLLVRTTSPEEMTLGLGRVLLPLRYVGVSEKRIATILSLSWTAFPFFWDTARATIRQANLKKAGNLRNLIPLLSSLIATLYMETESKSSFWEDAHHEQEDPLVS